MARMNEKRHKDFGWFIAGVMIAAGLFWATVAITSDSLTTMESIAFTAASLACAALGTVFLRQSLKGNGK